LDSWTNKLQRIGHAFTLISLIFFILAVSGPTITRTDMWSNAPQLNYGVDTSRANYTSPVVNDRASDTLGLFYHCEATGFVSRCRFIKGDCSVSADHSQPAETPQLLEGLSDCAEFNGIRSTAVLALLFTGLAWLSQHAFIHKPQEKQSKRVGYFSVGIHQLGWIFGLVSMSLALDYFAHLPTPNFGYAFWLLVIAWPLSLLGELVFFQGVVAEEVAPAKYLAEWSRLRARWGQGQWGQWYGVSRDSAGEPKQPAAAPASAPAAAAAPEPAPAAAPAAPAQPKAEGPGEVSIEMGKLETKA